MPLSTPSEGDPGESVPSRAPKKHTPFLIWRPKKKQQLPPSNCGVFVPHPPHQAPLGEARTLEAVDESHVATEFQCSASNSGESQPLETTGDVPGPSLTESGLFKKSRAQPPEENKRKPVLGKLGNLFTAGRRRNTRNGVECPTSANAKSGPPKDVTAGKLAEKEGEKSNKPQGDQPKQTDACEEPGGPQKPQEPQDQPCFQEPVSHTELSPGGGSCSTAAAAGPQGHESDSSQLEPVEAEGETFPDATTAAKQLHSSLEKNSGREQAEAGEDAAQPGADRQRETAQQGSRGLQGSPGAAGESADGAPPDGHGSGDPPGDPPAEDAAVPRGRGAPGERSPSATVLTLDIYLRKTEAAPAAGEGGECSDPEDMEKRGSGRRSGRRRKSQKSTDAPSGAADGTARDDDAVFEDEAGPENGSAEKKGKPPRAATTDGGVVSTASPEPCKPGAGAAKAQQRGAGEAAERSRATPQPPAASPTKRRGRSRVPEAVPPSPVGGPRAAAKESTAPKKTPAPEPSPAAAAAKGAAGDSGDEATRVVPRELMVKSSSQLPDFRSEHKRSPLPNHFDGRGEGGRGKEAGRAAAASEGSDSSLKPRNHFGAGRSTVTTKVTLPAKPKNVELNLKTPKNLDSLSTEHNPFSQPVNKGNTATKISLFENKRVNGSPRHTETRAPRNLPPSSKTFVGRAKLNFAKKAKEMEQPEKKVTPTSHQNGVPGKEATTEMKATLSKEASVAVTRDQAVGAPPKAEAPSNTSCPPDPGAIAQVRVQDQLFAGEVATEAADCKALVENLTGMAHDSALGHDAHVPAPAATLKPQDSGSDSAPLAESSLGPSLPGLAPHQVDGPQGAGAPVSRSSVPGSTLKVSGNGSLSPEPPQCPGEENPSRLSGGREASPSRVLVQVRSFVLPVESPQEVSTHIITDSSEVREGQLPSCHNELEVVSVASCAPQKEEVGNQSSPPEGISCGEQHGARADPQIMQLKASEKSLPLQAQSQGDTKPPLAKSTCNSDHLQSPPRPAQSAVNGQDSPASVLNVSAGSDDSVLDSSSDMEKFTEIIKKMDSAVCVPQKKKKGRMPNSPIPPFAMPPIHEDNLEKVFDPNVFTFGLGKKKESQPEMSPAFHLMQNLDTKSKLRPKRTSAEQSVLFKSLHTYANGKDESPTPSEISDKENRDVPNGGVKRSRLEKSALFSSLLSSLPQDRVFAPSVTSVSTMTTSFSTSQNTSPSRSSVSQPVAEGAPPCSSEKQPNLPPGSSSLKVFNFDSSNASHSGLKSPSYMEKYLQRDEARKELDARSNLHLPETKFSEFLKLKNSDDTDKVNHAEGVLKSNYANSDTDFAGRFKSSRFDPSLSFSGMSLSESATLRGNVQSKINPRPGKVVIFREPEVSEECIEVFGDIQDCSSWSLSPVILVKVVRGCWILYEKPNFEGNSIPLEEGELELSGLWGIEDVLEKSEETESAKPVVIGSIRHVVQDYRISQIDLFTEPEGLGIQNSYFDDAEEMQGFGVMQKTCSIKVHWGTWLIYEGPGYQGVPFILEPGEYPDLSFWDTEEAYIGSMRPLKMGGRKVEYPTDPKVIIYEKPFFEGKCVELETEMCSFVEGGEAEGKSGDGPLPFTAVGSMKVLRGIWVAYEKPGFTGHQYLLEEGEYKDWKDWGGYNEELQSLRPILGDFSNAHMIMYSEKNFGSKGSSIDVLGIVANLKETGYGVKTQSINVLSGVWVAYENPDFTGEQYVLDKGFYTSFEDWGGKNCKISSVQPICLDSFSGPRKRNQIHLFSEPQFQGSSQSFEETTCQIGDSFSAKSCRVLGGSWVAYDGENFTGNQYVLEEGHYPSLSAMGCLSGATFKSLRFIDAEFSEPTIILFEREGFKGKKIELNAETVNLQSLGFNTQIRSVQVIGGIWVTYEYGNYRGRQILLSPAEVPNWYEFSGCRQIGSLRPFIQKRIYFRLRNKATGLFMSTNGNLEDLKLLRIQVMEDVGADDQIWIYQEGCIKCRIAEDCCLTIVGSLVTSGSKLGLALDQNAESQFWSMKSDGRIYSKMKPNLVLDIKGGTQYDQSHIILNTVNHEKVTQMWEAIVL